ncbi:MAG TPA: nuclear transport factor 2 family protein [Burkholderiaceae bacterium]|nr:nuclear transport factor 2 family protein [Burkholderiaceae bacterium]
MNEQDNISLVKRCYDSFAKGDIQQLMSVFADDIDWELPAIEDVPISGKRHGRNQVAEFFKSLDDTQSVQLFEPREFIAQGDKVVALGHYAWTVKSTGTQFESDWTHIFTIRNGKVVNFREFMDSHIAEAAYRSPQAADMARGAATQAEKGQPTRH